MPSNLPTLPETLILNCPTGGSSGIKPVSSYMTRKATLATSMYGMLTQCWVGGWAGAINPTFTLHARITGMETDDFSPDLLDSNGDGVEAGGIFHDGSPNKPKVLMGVQLYCSFADVAGTGIVVLHFDPFLD